MEDAQVVERVGGVKEQEHRDQESDVPDAVVEKGLLPGRRRGVAVEVVAHQPVGAHPDALPADEGDEQVVREHEEQHGKHEEVEVEEELAKVLLPLHVANGVEVNQRRDTRHEETHRDRQGVHQQRRGHVQRADVDPVKEVHRQLAVRVSEQQEEGDDGEDETQRHHAGADDADGAFLQARAVREHEEEPHQGHQEQERGDGGHLSPSTQRVRQPTSRRAVERPPPRCPGQP